MAEKMNNKTGFVETPLEIANMDKNQENLL
jgi:hypothetical protein